MIKFVRNKEFENHIKSFTGYIDANDNMMLYEKDTVKNFEEATERFQTLKDCTGCIDCDDLVDCHDCYKCEDSSNLSACYEVRDSKDCYECEDSYNISNCESVTRSGFCENSVDLDQCFHCIECDTLFKCEQVFHGKHCNEVKNGFNIESCISSSHIYNSKNVGLSSYIFNEDDAWKKHGFSQAENLTEFMKDIGA
jgi:hypothetical protein